MTTPPPLVDVVTQMLAAAQHDDRHTWALAIAIATGATVYGEEFDTITQAADTAATTGYRASARQLLATLGIEATP